MSEVILPCPFCGNTSPRTTAKIDGVWCDKEECPNRQNTYAVDVWNALPRALRWTHEPPKVEGWYWCSDDEESDVYPIISYYDEWAIKEVLSKINDGKTRFKWAGPIAPPIG